MESACNCYKLTNEQVFVAIFSSYHQYSNSPGLFNASLKVYVGSGPKLVLPMGRARIPPKVLSRLSHAAFEAGRDQLSPAPSLLHY